MNLYGNGLAWLGCLLRSGKGSVFRGSQDKLVNHQDTKAPRGTAPGILRVFVSSCLSFPHTALVHHADGKLPRRPGRARPNPPISEGSRAAFKLCCFVREDYCKEEKKSHVGSE